MDAPAPGNRLASLLNSPANWCGISAASLALAAPVFATVTVGWWLPPIAYALGFGAGGLVFGYPRWSGAGWALLDAPALPPSARQALEAVAALVQANPQDRLAAPVQDRLLRLLARLRPLIAQLDQEQRRLSPEDVYHARQIVLQYLPQALRAYLAIPREHSQRRALPDGRTAEAALIDVIDDLDRKTQQLAEAEAAQDLQAFANHARFLKEKFGVRSGDSPHGPSRPPEA